MNKYDPNIHHRRSIRLKGYDYAQAGLYFITICCRDRICRFGTIEKGKMALNKFGQIAHNEWMKLSERFPYFELDVFQIMPNHMHGIISLKNIPVRPVRAGFTPAPNDASIPNDRQFDQMGQPQGTAPTVSAIVGAYKSLVANECLNIYKSKNEIMGKLWQRNYYEHIIRNEQSYKRISEYITNNPIKWAEDKFHQ